MSKIKVVSLNISEKKGTVKSPVDSIVINELGIDGDAHAGKWHRQISLLGVESFNKMKEGKGKDLELGYGVFAENITTEGLELHKTSIFDRFENSDLILEVTQIGKKCHHGCEIFKIVGDCVMPREGIFTRVIKGGKLKIGDELLYNPRIVKVKVITLSDRAYSGVYEDRSGPLATKLLQEFFEGSNRKYTINNEIIPDEPEKLKEMLLNADNENYDIVVTTGGTGLGKRDFTPDVVKSVIDKEIPGIMEHIRIKYGAKSPNALVSRSIAGVMNNTLIYAIPGSVKAVTEYINEITPTIEHCFRMLNSIDVH